MVTARTGWPDQLLLPGQATAHPGPVDLTTAYVMHHAFRRDLAAFAAAAAAAPVQDRARWRLLTGRWELFTTSLQHHRRGEDAGLWPLLLARADAAGRQVLIAMEQEHAEIDPLLESCGRGLTALTRTADEDVRAALVVRLVAARESLARHLAHEETSAFALVQRHLSAAEWEQLESEQLSARRLPVRTRLALLPWAVHGLPAATEHRLVANAPRARRVAWRLTRPAFERRERRTFDPPAA